MHPPSRCGNCAFSQLVWRPALHAVRETSAMNSFLRSGAITFLLCHPFFLGVGSVRGRSSMQEQLRQGTLSEPMSSILPNASAVSALVAAQQCVELPTLPANDRLQGPHGTTLISTKCEVLAYHAVAGVPAGGWTTARYRWTSVFTAEDSARGPAARDTATEEEAVLRFNHRIRFGRFCIIAISS